MVEVLFGESEAGAMKFAQSSQASLAEGNEVLCLAYMLDIGSIQEACDSNYRQELLFSMYTQSGWDDSTDYLNGLRDGIRESMEEYHRLCRLLEKGEELRIWYSHAPYSICGLYWLCSRLLRASNKIYTVELPRYQEKERNVIVQYRNWGEVPEEQMLSFLPLQKELTGNERRMFAHKWTELVEDNSPLRAEINGEVIGVPENFYDFLIRNRITEEPVREARLIGDLLGAYPVLLSDWWYAARIEQMIQTGEIRILEDSRRKYTRLLCLAGDHTL